MEESDSIDIGDLMLEFRKYRPEDLPGCLALIRAGHDPDFSEDRFRWLHEGAPDGPSEIALCIDGKLVVGIYSVIPKTLALNGRIFLGGRDVDPVVLPSHRGQGVFTRLLQFGLAHFQRLDFLFNFANKTSSFGFLKNGWEKVMVLEDRVCQLGYPKLISREFLIWLASRARCRQAKWVSKCLDPGEIEDLLFDPKFINHWQSQSGRLGVNRSPEYLKWRYLDNPMHEYLWFREGEPQNSFQVAVGRYNPHLKSLHILDWTGTGDHPSLDRFLPLWGNQFPGASVSLWSSVPTNCRRCFVGNPLKSGNGLNFLVRPFPGKSTPENLLAGDHWFLTSGDLEIN